MHNYLFPEIFTRNFRIAAPWLRTKFGHSFSCTKGQTKANPTKKPLSALQRGAFCCDPAGIRTQDPYIKSVLLYQLSYRIGTLHLGRAFPSLVAQKYYHLLNYTTLIQKKVFSFSVRPLFLFLILLPLWTLGAKPAAEKSSFASTPGQLASLLEADSLFTAGQYAASFPDYRQQVWQQRQASPQLLLKMAYAQQQLGHYPAALLYLSMAQARQPRVRTWRQLAALAAQHQLVGYPATWQQEVRVQAQRYYYPGLQTLLGGALVGAIWLLWRRSPRGAWVGYAAYVGLLGAYLHLLRPAPAGLVARSGAALMAGPGAGATWLSTAAMGDRLPVLGRQDIWYRVQWQQREAFVRAADLLVVE
jgi:hypothetical protein